MTPSELKLRTKRFAVDIVKFARTLPTDPVTVVIARQIVKSGTSVGANYRSSCRGKSKADFISKIAIAEDEADETQYWLEVLVESGAVRPDAVAKYMDEADQLVRIFVASINTARGSRRSNNHQ
jgi:four helix bundle protein